MGIARGAQVVDLNLDGQLDLVVVNRWTPAEIWRQSGEAAGNWVQVRLDQPGVNRDAIGSVVEIRRGTAVERHEIASGGGMPRARSAGCISGWARPRRPSCR